jgi:tellurite resistance protein TehA-like permease
VLLLLRPLLAGSILALWAFASWLIPLLAALDVWRYVRGRIPLRYRGDLWAAIFPAGMYATASMRLGPVAGIPPITWIGRGAAWVAAAAWLVTFTALLAAKLPAVAARIGRWRY